MISKVTVNNSDALKKRLDDISNALGKKINNLEEYYANIVEISQLPTTRSDPYKYFLMPLDEPLFEIDADKRTITVPSHFAKNGVGVYGDHMAEVLYFRVDRYFDYQDLYNVDDIIINWQFRPSSVSRNAKIETHTSKALAPDETYDPGHIVFGWVIGNYTTEIDEDGNETIAYMTPGKGVLTFSVSFIKRSGDRQEFEYVLNTQAVSVNIQDSLVLDKPIKLDSIDKPMFKKLMNSSYSDEGLALPIAPIFLSGEEVNDKDGISRYSGLNSFANFDFSSDKTQEEDKLALSVLAGTLDDTVNTSIKYCWAGTDHDGGILNPEETWKTSEYILSNDIEYFNSKLYYIEDSNIGGFKLINKEEFEEARENDINIFESGSIQEISKGGSYAVAIQSVKTVNSIDSEGVEHTATAISPIVNSKACYIPRAAVPQIELYIDQENDIFEEEEAFESQLLKIADKDRKDKQSDGSLINYVYFDQELDGSIPPALKAKINIDETKIEKSVLDAEGNYITTGVPGVTKDSSLGFIKFYVTKDGENGKPFEATYSNIVNDHGVYVAEESAPFNLNVGNDANGAGEWQAYAVNERNHTFSISDISNKIYVSKVAPSLHINLTYSGLDLFGNPSVDDPKVILTNNERVAEHNLSDKPVTISGAMSAMRFYCDATPPENAPEDFESIFELIELDVNGNPLVAGNDEPNIYSLNNGAFDVAEGGYFCVKATTLYHGTKRVTISDPFLVTTAFN